MPKDNNLLKSQTATQYSSGLKRMILIPLFTAIIVVFTLLFPPIFIPLYPAPITLQSLAIMVVGLLLSPKDAFLSAGLYVVIGMIGLPVFAGGTGGLHVLFGTTGGFIIAFPIAAFVISVLKNYIHTKNSIIQKAMVFLIALFGGVVITYLIGAIWIAKLTGINYLLVLKSFVIYLPGDITKAIISTFIYSRLSKVVNSIY